MLLVHLRFFHPHPRPLSRRGREEKLSTREKYAYKKARALFPTPPLVFNIVVIVCDYDFLQPHLPHLQSLPQEQFLPSQLGHLQSSHPHLATAAAVTTASASIVKMLQHDFFGRLVLVAEASQTPSQSEQPHTAQSQPAVAELVAGPLLAKAMA